MIRQGRGGHSGGMAGEVQTEAGKQAGQLLYLGLVPVGQLVRHRSCDVFACLQELTFAGRGDLQPMDATVSPVRYPLDGTPADQMSDLTAGHRRVDLQSFRQCAEPHGRTGVGLGGQHRQRGEPRSTGVASGAAQLPCPALGYGRNTPCPTQGSICCPCFRAFRLGGRASRPGGAARRGLSAHGLRWSGDRRPAVRMRPADRPPGPADRGSASVTVVVVSNRALSPDAPTMLDRLLTPGSRRTTPAAQRFAPSAVLRRPDHPRRSSYRGEVTCPLPVSPMRPSPARY